MTVQQTHALKLLTVIRSRIENGEPPINGYGDAAATIGLNGAEYGRAMGQVCSLIDAASFVAGWPMLALGMVRMPDGSINPESFTGAWGPWTQETKSMAHSHKWTVQQVDSVMGVLAGLPEEGASAQWLGYLKREAQRPGFIRFNLHRKLRAT